MENSAQSQRSNKLKVGRYLKLEKKSQAVSVRHFLKLLYNEWYCMGGGY